MPITDYASLSAEVNEWIVRSYSADQLDMFIGLAEAEFNLILGPTYRRTVTATVTTNASGVATLPNGFRHMRALVRDLLGSRPLKQMSWEALADSNPYAVADDADFFAISGTTLKVAPVVEDDFLATYDAALTGLSSSNQTNWLITIAPQAYLFMTLASAYTFEEDFQRAAGLEAKARQIVETLLAQDMAAQFGNVVSHPDVVMP